METTWTKRQIGLVNKWDDEFKQRGIIVAYTAFGKSSGIGMRVVEKFKGKRILITVPSIKLKLDWEEKLFKAGIFAHVLVVNTVIKNVYEVDLLIIDEIHRFAADTFSLTFSCVKANAVLGLTATLERNDGKHDVILNELEIVDTVTIEEGLENGWVDSFEIIKIPIQLTEEEEENLNIYNVAYDKAKKTLGKGNPMRNAKLYIKYLDLKKWVISKKSGKLYFMREIRDKFGDMGKDLFDLTLKTHFYIPTKEHIVYKKALAALSFYNAVQDRKNLLYNAENKITRTLELIEQYKDEYKFVFSQRIGFLEKLAENMSDNKFSMYHSNMSKKERAKAFKGFNDDHTEIKTMLSVKSLIEGIDIPKLSVSIITSFTSSLIDRTQTWGRTMRKYKNKRAVIIYLYVPGTQEEVWLNKVLI